MSKFISNFAHRKLEIALLIKGLEPTDYDS